MSNENGPSTFQKWRLVGCGGFVGLLIGAASVAFYFVQRDMRIAAEALAEADQLHKDGKSTEAVAKYKQAYTCAGSRKADLIQRIVDHEVAHGSGDEARKWIDKGLEDKLSLSFDSSGGRSLLAAAHKDRESKVAQKRTEEAEHEKQRQVDKDARTKQLP